VRGFSLPTLISRRGAGLGNELIPWGKALLGAEELGLRPLHPAWALNPRGYRGEFGTSRLDWIGHEGLRRIARREVITRDDVRATGATDYREALEILASDRRLRDAFVVEHASGMYGGYLAIKAARGLLLRELVRPRASAEALYSLETAAVRGRLTLGFHIRSGDFGRTDEIRPGLFNVALPRAWYLSVAERFAAELDGEVQALVVTDGDDRALSESLRRVLPVVDLRLGRHTSVGDLCLLASADVLVCSISSFSLAAAFLSDRPYVWFAPHLNEIGGWLSLWGHEEDQRQGPTASASRAEAAASDVGRGIPLSWDDSLPPHAIDLLRGALLSKQLNRDLIYYGAVGTPGAAATDSVFLKETGWRR
jgi:hypothetical protein